MKVNSKLKSTLTQSQQRKKRERQKKKTARGQMLVPTIFSLTWVCVPKKKEEAYIAEEGMAESIVLRTR